MLKKYLTKYPLWFVIILGCVLVEIIIVILTGYLVLLFGGMIVLYIANAVRAWKDDRKLAIVSLVLAVVFSYIFYKFLTL
jgi:hypothetical protein